MAISMFVFFFSFLLLQHAVRHLHGDVVVLFFSTAQTESLFAFISTSVAICADIWLNPTCLLLLSPYIRHYLFSFSC